MSNYATAHTDRTKFCIRSIVWGVLVCAFALLGFWDWLGVWLRILLFLMGILITGFTISQVSRWGNISGEFCIYSPPSKVNLSFSWIQKVAPPVGIFSFLGGVVFLFLQILFPQWLFYILFVGAFLLFSGMVFADEYWVVIDRERFEPELWEPY
ncbi:MAG: hypothetical protein KKA90_00665 [Nanoarchaeota archaeon]|nr:hypothetical protein [Nanoarchaeota archaeon]